MITLTTLQATCAGAALFFAGWLIGGIILCWLLGLSAKERRREQLRRSYHAYKHYLETGSLPN